MCIILTIVFFHCSGNTPETKGTAFVVYEDIFDAKNACDHLSGFNVCNRYLVVLYYQSNKVGPSSHRTVRGLYPFNSLEFIVNLSYGSTIFWKIT